MAKARNTTKPISPGLAKKTKKKPVASGELPRAVAQVALDRATTRIRGLQRDLRANAWKIGRELTRVSELKLFAARGHDTFEGYADSVLGLSRDSAYQYTRVSEAFAETMVVTYGVEKLDRLLRYIAATPERDGPEDAPTLTIRVPKDGGGVTEKPFPQTSLHELRAATGAERAAQRGEVAGDHDGAREVARTLDADARDEVQEALEAALEEALGRSAAGIEVRVLAGGGSTLSLRGVRLEHADAALAALRVAMKKALAEVWTDA